MFELIKEVEVLGDKVKQYEKLNAKSQTIVSGKLNKIGPKSALSAKRYLFVRKKYKFLGRNP